MSSEELRLDLESFINKGLKEGWRGWPVKKEARTGACISKEVWFAFFSERNEKCQRKEYQRR